MARVDRWVALSAGSALAALTIVACSSPTAPLSVDTSSETTPHTGVSWDGGADTGPATSQACLLPDGVGSCSIRVGVCGPVINQTETSAAPPKPTGGAITPGLYTVTSFTVFSPGGANAPTSDWLRATLLIGLTGGDDGGSAPATQFTYEESAEETFATSGGSRGSLVVDPQNATGSFGRECGDEMQILAGYTATATTFAYFFATGSDTAVATFTLVP